MRCHAVRRRVLVHGHVQGVFFRDSVRREADAAAVAGWVRNNRDGTLEAVFEGPAGPVDALVRFCRAGPPDARVDRLDVSDEPPEGRVGFEIR